MPAAGKSAHALLEQTPFLSDLSPGDLAKVTAIATVEEYDSPTVLFQEGCDCDRLYVVSRGLVAVEMCMPRRGCVRVLTVGPNEIVGLSPLLSNARMTARATIVEPSTLVAFSAQQLRSLCDADHDVGYAVMTQISVALKHRLLATRLQLLDVFGETEPVNHSVTRIR